MVLCMVRYSIPQSLTTMLWNKASYNNKWISYRSLCNRNCAFSCSRIPSLAFPSALGDRVKCILDVVSRKQASGSFTWYFAFLNTALMLRCLKSMPRIRCSTEKKTPELLHFTVSKPIGFMIFSYWREIYSNQEKVQNYEQCGKSQGNIYLRLSITKNSSIERNSLCGFQNVLEVTLLFSNLMKWNTSLKVSVGNTGSDWLHTSTCDSSEEIYWNLGCLNLNVTKSSLFTEYFSKPVRDVVLNIMSIPWNWTFQYWRGTITIRLLHMRFLLTTRHSLHATAQQFYTNNDRSPCYTDNDDQDAGRTHPPPTQKLDTAKKWVACSRLLMFTKGSLLRSYEVQGKCTDQDPGTAEVIHPNLNQKKWETWHDIGHRENKLSRCLGTGHHENGSKGVPWKQCIA